MMVLEASDAIPPLTKESSITTKYIPKMDIIQIVKSNTKRLAEIKVWGDGQECSNVSIRMETKRVHTLSEGDQSVTALRKQQDGERSILEGWREEVLFPHSLGAKVESVVCLLYRCWKLIPVKWEKEHKDWISLPDGCWKCYESGWWPAVVKDLGKWKQG